MACEGDLGGGRRGEVREREDRGIILISCATGEGLPLSDEMREKVAVAASVLHDFGEGPVLKVFAGAVLHLEDAVREEHPLAAGAEGNRQGLIAGGARDAEGGIARSGHFPPLSAIKDACARQSGAAEPDAALFRTDEHGIDSDEASGFHHPAEALVQCLHPFRERHGDAEMSSGSDESGAARHVQSSGQAFAADIADAEEDFAVIDLMPEIKVAAYLAGGFIKGLDHYIAQFCMRCGEEGVLDFFGQGQLLAGFSLADGFFLRFEADQGDGNEAAKSLEELHILCGEGLAVIGVDGLHDAEAAGTIQKRDGDHGAGDEDGLVRVGAKMAGVAESILDIDNLFGGIDVAGDALAFGYTDLHGIDGVERGADAEVLAGAVWQEDGADLAVHDFARALEDVIHELDVIVGAAEAARHVEEDALARGDGLRITHGL